MAKVQFVKVLFLLDHHIGCTGDATGPSASWTVSPLLQRLVAPGSKGKNYQHDPSRFSGGRAGLLEASCTLQLLCGTSMLAPGVQSRGSVLSTGMNLKSRLVFVSMLP